MPRSLVSLLCGAAFIATGSLQGQIPVVLYSTLGPADSYNTHGGCYVSGPDHLFGYFVCGFPFVPSAAARLDTIEVAFGEGGSPHTITLQLRSANGPLEGPGDLIESFVLNDMGPLGFANPVIKLTSTTRPLLTAGTTYWLVGMAEGNSIAYWNVNDQEIKGRFYSIQGGSEVLLDDQLLAAYRVSGIAITDTDDDGVIDPEDECDGTSPGSVVDANGCSIDQLVPCAGPLTGGNWNNHGQYVREVLRIAKVFHRAGLITPLERNSIVRAAARSHCGKKMVEPYVGQARRY